MPLYIRFEKSQAEQFLLAVKSGAAIDGDGAWTRNRLLTLAGVCIFAAQSQGPDAFQPQLEGSIDPAACHPEQREAIGQTFLMDLRGALEFVTTLAEAVEDGHYDEQFEPMLLAAVSGGCDPATVHAISGFKHSGGDS